MSRKKPPTANEFLFFDVVYDDGMQTSNRKVASADVQEWDVDGSIKSAIEAQDREIRERSGRARGEIKTITKAQTR
jgi:hypothetical protein